MVQDEDNDRIDELLRRLKARLEKKAPDLLEALGAPASRADIQALEGHLGVALPGAVRAFYLRHDGADDDAAILPSSEEACYSPLSLAEVRETWDSARRHDVLPAGLVPIGTDGGGDHLCIDLSANASPRGRVIEFLHETLEQRVVAPSFDALLTDLVEGLDARRFRIVTEGEDDDVGIVRVDPNAPPPKKKKLPTDAELGLWHSLRLLQEESPTGGYWPIPASPELVAALDAIDPERAHFGKAPGARLTALFKLRVHGAGEFFKYAEPKCVHDLHGLRFYPIREVVHLNKDHWVPPPKRWPLVFATTVDAGHAVCFDLTRNDAVPPIVLYPAGFALAKRTAKQLASAGRVIASDLLDFLAKLPRGELDLRV